MVVSSAQCFDSLWHAPAAALTSRSVSPLQPASSDELPATTDGPAAQEVRPPRPSPPPAARRRQQLPPPSPVQPTWSGSQQGQQGPSPSRRPPTDESAFPALGGGGGAPAAAPGINWAATRRAPAPAEERKGLQEHDFPVLGRVVGPRRPSPLPGAKVEQQAARPGSAGSGSSSSAAASAGGGVSEDVRAAHKVATLSKLGGVFGWACRQALAL